MATIVKVGSRTNVNRKKQQNNYYKNITSGAAMHKQIRSKRLRKVQNKINKNNAKLSNERKQSYKLFV